MLEFLNPETPLFLSHSKAPTSKHPYQLEGVAYRNQFVPLHTGLTNHLAQKLILPQLFPNATIQSEVTFGNARLDFVVTRTNHPPLAIEVKNCSLVEQGVALFPDAPSKRATKHLATLSTLLASGWDALLLIVVTHSEPKLFRPLVHTDPDFALALESCGVPLRVVSLGWNISGKLEQIQLQVPYDVSVAQKALGKSGLFIGAYLVGETRLQGGNPYWKLRWEVVERNFSQVVRNPHSYVTKIESPSRTCSKGKKTKYRYWTLWSADPERIEQQLMEVLRASPWQQQGPSVYNLGNQAPEEYRPFLDFIFSLQTGNAP